MITLSDDLKGLTAFGLRCCFQAGQPLVFTPIIPIIRLAPIIVNVGSIAFHDYSRVSKSNYMVQGVF